MSDVNSATPPQAAASPVDPRARTMNAGATPAPPAPESSARQVLHNGSLPMRAAASLPSQFEQSLQNIARK
jgi:hypothetical protein